MKYEYKRYVEYTHIYNTMDMVIKDIYDVAKFMEQIDVDINTVDNYQVNGIYVTGSDLINHMFNKLHKD